MSVVKRTAAKATRSLLYRHHLQHSFPDQTGISHRELTEPAGRSAAATVPGPPSVLLACGSGQLGQAVREAKHSGKGAPRSTEISVRATARTHLGTALAHAGDIWRVGVLVDAADRIHSR